MPHLDQFFQKDNGWTRNDGISSGKYPHILSHGDQLWLNLRGIADASASMNIVINIKTRDKSLIQCIMSEARHRDRPFLVIDAY